MYIFDKIKNRIRSERVIKTHRKPNLINFKHKQVILDTIKFNPLKMTP